MSIFVIEENAEIEKQTKTLNNNPQTPE